MRPLAASFFSLSSSVRAAAAAATAAERLREGSADSLGGVISLEYPGVPRSREKNILRRDLDRIVRSMTFEEALLVSILGLLPAFLEFSLLLSRFVSYQFSLVLAERIDKKLSSSACGRCHCVLLKNARVTHLADGFCCRLFFSSLDRTKECLSRFLSSQVARDRLFIRVHAEAPCYRNKTGLLSSAYAVVLGIRTCAEWHLSVG